MGFGIVLVMKYVSVHHTTAELSVVNTQELA